MKGVYLHKRTDFQGGYIVDLIRVEVIGETPKSYKVRSLEFSGNGWRPGYETFVLKKNVRLGDEPRPAASHAYRTRLPYKD